MICVPWNFSLKWHHHRLSCWTKNQGIIIDSIFPLQSVIRPYCSPFQKNLRCIHDWSSLLLLTLSRSYLPWSSAVVSWIHLPDNTCYPQTVLLAAAKFLNCRSACDMPLLTCFGLLSSLQSLRAYSNLRVVFSPHLLSHSSSRYLHEWLIILKSQPQISPP